MLRRYVSRDPELAVQFLRYLVAGGTAAATLMLVLVALIELFGVPSTLASAIAFLCAIPVNYSLQRQFVFRIDAAGVATFARYVFITLATLCLNTALFWLLFDLGQVQYFLSQAVALAVVVVVNFVANRSYTFGTSPAKHRVRQ